MKDSKPDKFKIGPEPRANWKISFKVMHACGDDELLIHDVFEDEFFDDILSKESGKP